MAIDTPAKRSSALDHEEPWAFGTPLPDGTIGQGDRQHLIWSYSGILVGAVAGIPVQLCFEAAEAVTPWVDQAEAVTPWIEQAQAGCP